MTNLSSLRSSGLRILATQIFTGNGTWNKVTAGVYVWVRAIGGGAGGTAAANNVAALGGELLEAWFSNSVLGSTEAVTIGAGGTGSISTPTAGGSTAFGSFLLAKGGRASIATNTAHSLTAVQDTNWHNSEIRAGLGARVGVAGSATAGRAGAAGSASAGGAASSSWPDTGGGGDANLSGVGYAGGNYGGGGGGGQLTTAAGGNGASGALIAVTWG
jgi:hypothetical protein